jgi:hypothetical protein
MRHIDLGIGLTVKKKHYIILAALLTIVFGITYGRAAIFTHELVITVVKIDAPEVCHDGTSLLHRRFRSSTPEHNYLGYCGFIRAANGFYKLPTSSEFLSPHDLRSNLLAQLTVGCEYRVKIVGAGPPFRASEGLTNRNNHVISHILETFPCEAD